MAELAPWTRHLPTGTDPSSLDLLGEVSLPRAWSSRWAAAPDAPAVRDDSTRWVTSAELEARSRSAAGRLAGAGVGAGDRVLVSAASSVDLVVAHVGALRLGAVVVPANTASLPRELAHVVHDARPVVAVVDRPDAARTIGELDPSIVVTAPALPLDDPPPSAAPALDVASSTDPALLAYTSGTTGTPKGALLSHGNLLASAEALRLAWRWAPDDRLVLPLPLFHLHGLGVGLHGTLLAGASVVIQDGFEPVRVLDAVAEHRATLFFGVPTLWSRLAACTRVGELRRLRLGVSGSAPLDAAMHATIVELTGQHLIERYGMTETVMLVSNPYDGERRAGTVGIPLPQVDVRLAEETDEILVRGPNVLRGYWERPEADLESFVDGWFATGDVGEVDDAGYLRIVGRCKDLIITGGYNVYPREVEDVLRTHPAVGDVAVVGVPDPDWGEAVVAVIEGDPGEEASIAALARAQLAPYKRPKRIEFLTALPRNALGKVVKPAVRDLLG